MDTARCYRCGFTMRGVFRKGPPAACPACGFSRSKEVVALMAQQKAEAAEYARKGFIGKVWHRVKRVFRKRQEAIV